MNILTFILAGLAIAIVFRVLRRILRAVALRESFRKAGLKGLPAIELAAWVVYAFWGVHVFFGNHLFFDVIVMAMVIILLALLAWFVLRDFLAGVLIRAEKSLEHGQVMRTSSVSGKIRKLGSLSLEIMNDAGEVVRIPYSRLNQDLITLPPQRDDNLPHHVEIAVPVGQDAGLLKKKIKVALLAMPWIVSPAPEAEVIRDADGNTALRVTYHTHMRSHASLVEERLSEILAGEVIAPGSP